MELRGLLSGDGGAGDGLHCSAGGLGGTGTPGLAAVHQLTWEQSGPGEGGQDTARAGGQQWGEQGGLSHPSESRSLRIELLRAGLQCGGWGRAGAALCQAAGLRGDMGPGGTAARRTAVPGRTTGSRSGRSS